MNTTFWLPRVIRLSVEHLAWEHRDRTNSESKRVISYAVGLRHLMLAGARHFGLIGSDDEFKGSIYQCGTCGEVRGCPRCPKCSSQDAA